MEKKINKYHVGDLVEYKPVHRLSKNSNEITPEEYDYGIVVKVNVGTGWEDEPTCSYYLTTQLDYGGSENTIDFRQDDIVRKINGKIKISAMPIEEAHFCRLS